MFNLEVLKFRSCYDDEDQNIKKTKLYKSVRVYARIFRAKVAVGSLGLPEGNPSTDVDASDPTFLATGKYPSVLELNLVETIISALAHTRLEDACDVMVDEGMVESVKSLIQVLCEINDRVATLLGVVKDEKDPRIVSVSEVLKEACYCMSLLASKSCHQDRVADAGVIPVLVQIISNFNSKQKEKPPRSGRHHIFCCETRRRRHHEPRARKSRHQIHRETRWWYSAVDFLAALRARRESTTRRRCRLENFGI